MITNIRSKKAEPVGPMGGRLKEKHMRNYTKFYIDGQWVQPTGVTTLDVINPANESVAGRISMGSAADVDAAVKAARAALALAAVIGI